MESIRTIIALAVRNNMTVEQLDITIAYLNGTLSERIYMEVRNYIQQGLRILKIDGIEAKSYKKSGFTDASRS